MQKLFYILLLIFPAFTYAQEQTKADSLLHENVEELSSVPEALADSLQEIQDMTELPEMTAVLDTLPLKNKVDSLLRLQTSLDTLQLKQTLDSLRQAPLPTEVAQAKVDSIQDLLDVAAHANQQIRELNQRLNQPLNDSRQSLQGKVNKATRLEGVNQEALADLKEQTGVELNTNLPEVEGLSLQEIDGQNLPALDLPTVDFPGGELPTGGSLPSLDLPAVEGLEEVEDGLGKLGEIGDQLDPYTEDLNRLSEGNLQDIESADKIAEQQLLNTEAGKNAQQQMGLSQAGKGELEQLAGRDFLEEQAKDKVYEAAVDHFAGNTEALKEAQGQMAKYKVRYEEVQSVKEMPKGIFKPNPLRDKPWQERLVIGSLWQFGKQERLVVDLGPTLAWRFNDKISAGGGYQYRLSIHSKKKPWVSSADKVYGYHLFADYGIKKGFFGRLIYENLNAVVPRPNSKPLAEQTHQQWIKGVSLGLGKSYTFYKSVQGYALVQYNLLHRSRKTPYTRALQAKIGFFINGKQLKRKKSPKTE